MLNLKKEADSLKVNDLELGICPVCTSCVSHIYFMQDAKTKVASKWYSCACGVVWQAAKPKGEYGKKYWDDYDQYDLKIADAFKYPVKMYAPLIEELVYGRKVLIVGRTTQHQEMELASRGWVPYAIDKNESQPKSSRFICGDFETYEFHHDTKFSMIWLYQTLECFTNHLASISKLKSLLTEDGILFIASPDTDFINTRSSSGFIHWKPEHNYLMWNRRALTNHLEKLGFNVIMARPNYEHRFAAWDDFHLIAQVKFF